MNIFLWIVQILLALHTLMGAVWKFSNSAEQTMPTLAAIPENIWLGMSILEILFAIVLILPMFKRSFGRWVPIAALGIAAEMFVFCILHKMAGDPNFGPMMYWLTVAAICAVVGYGRWKLKPIK